MSKLPKLLLLGGLAAGGVALLKRDRVKALLGSSRPEPASPPSPPQAPPPVSNYDVSGPVENTATPVPTPPPYQPPVIDEAVEEAAAAAEAANIGGPVSDYAGGELGQTAGPEERPLAEAGEGESEGQEQTEAELAAAAEPTAPGASDEQRQIEDAMDRAANPLAPEIVEPLRPGGEPSPGDAEQRAHESGNAAGASGAQDAEGGGSDDDGAEWRTWSGRSVQP